MIIADKLLKNFYISKIKKIGKSVISVTCDSYTRANTFVELRDKLPKGWISYIPNFKILRTGVVRGVHSSLSTQKIINNITWMGDPIRIFSVERLKFKSRDSGEIKDSASIKIVFESDLLPEYMYILRCKCKVFPYINKVRRCNKCSRWGQFSSVGVQYADPAEVITLLKTAIRKH